MGAILLAGRPSGIVCQVARSGDGLSDEVAPTASPLWTPWPRLWDLRAEAPLMWWVKFLVANLLISLAAYVIYEVLGVW